MQKVKGAPTVNVYLFFLQGHINDFTVQITTKKLLYGYTPLFQNHLCYV
jgi:hypothetical protein